MINPRKYQRFKSIAMIKMMTHNHLPKFSAILWIIARKTKAKKMPIHLVIQQIPLMVKDNQLMKI